MNTKTIPFTYEAAHCLYAGRMDKIKEGVWMGDFNKPGDIELFPMEEEECLDSSLFVRRTQRIEPQ